MRIVIIGNGVAGVTAARHIRKQADYEVIIISKETNYFYSRTALMYIFMGSMRYEHTKPYEDWFWDKNNINLLRGTVESVDFEHKTIHLSPDSQWVIHTPSLLEKITKTVFKSSTKPPISNNNTLSYDKLIIATGSVPRLGAWKGESLLGVQGLYSYQDLELLEQNAKNVQKAVVVGGGLIGVELAEMLLSRQIEVTMLVREPSYWRQVLPPEESALITRHIRQHGVQLKLQTELQQILGNDSVEAIITNAGEKIDCQLVGTTIGVKPNVDFLRFTPLMLKKGILVNQYLETNIADVYAIGDCVEHIAPPEGHKNIEQIWYTGRAMGEVIANTICGNLTPYQPSIFFNSAKFFDIEYQIYGQIFAQKPTHIDTFYWQHPHKSIAFRIDYDRNSRTVKGVNSLGMRLRQSIWQKWLIEQQTVDFVIAHLMEANFDSEFSESNEKLIYDTFNAIKKL